MKKQIALLSALLLMCALVACDVKTYDDGYKEGWIWGYDEGYMDGLDQGYSEGINQAKQFLAFVVEDDLSSLERNIKREYGISPFDAITILSNYADVPDEVSEEELHLAILVIDKYYIQANEIISCIDSYDIFD